MKTLSTSPGAGHRALRCGWLNWRVVAGLVLAPCVLGLVEAQAQRTVLFPLNHVWRYNTDCQDGTGWEQPGYDDSAWPSGPGGFTGGETLAGLLPVLNTRTLPAPSAAGRNGAAMYFRTHFNIASVANVSLVLSNGVDDAAVFYLNGVRMFDLRVPDNPALCATFGGGAIGTGTDAMLWEVLTLDSAALSGILQPGDNVLAVEVHQVNNTSSDMVFVCSLASAIAFAPRCLDPDLPADANVLNGGSFTLTGSLDGAPTPTYQWFKDGAAIAGANNPTLTIAAATPADAGVYEIEATNPLGSARCRRALVTVTSLPPACLDPSQPADTNLLAGRPFTLAGSFSGAPPPTLQWFKDGAAIPGATSPTLTIPSASSADAGRYDIEAVNPFGVARCRAATVVVVTDRQGPRIVRASASPDGTSVVINWDEPLDPTTAQDPFNISVDGVLVTSATLVTPTQQVIAPAQPILPCIRARVELNGVADVFGNVTVPNPAVVFVTPALRLLAIDDTHQWRYEETGTDLGTAWSSPGYDDSAWLSGAAILGLESAALPEPIRTPLTVGANKPTFYFRTHFTLPTDLSTVTRLQLRQVLDDGAVYYLNGVEVFRSRIADGPVNFNTLAVNQATEGVYEGPFDLPLAALRCGDNVLAVEVHQSSLGSSDVVLGAELVADVTECRPCPVQGVTITDFFPREGGEGTLLTIIGGPWHGGSPDNHCAVLMKGNRFIDIEVLTATPTQLVARVGVIPPDCFGPLRLMVGVGRGARVALCPAERDIEVAPDNWIWRGDEVNAAVAPGPFFAFAVLPAGATPALVNFHSGGPMGGTLMVVLNKDWGVGSRYCISARIHSQGTGADTRIGPATFTGVGSRFKCAVAICDLLRQAFASHPTRPLNIICTVTTNGADAKITISLPNGAPIDGGNIDIIQKAPPPIVTGLWDLNIGGLWRKEVRKREIGRWYRHYEWTTRNSIWFEKRAEGIWITREALESFTCQSHCIYRFPNGRVWIIWRTFRRVDLRRFWVHHRFWWPGRVNPGLAANDPRANRIAMSMDDVQITLPMTPQDPNPATPFNEGVMIVDENGQQHFQGEPGFEVMPDIAGNPNGYQLAATVQSTDLLPPAADRIRDLPMQPMPGMASLQPGVIIQWLVDKNGNVLVDHNQDGWPDPITSPHVLGGQKHQGLIAPATGVANNALTVDQGNNQLQLYCWELDANGEVVGAQPGEAVIGPPVDLDADGLADNAAGAAIPMDPTVRELVVDGAGIREVRDPNAQPVELDVIEEAAPTDAQLAALNQRLAAQLPGFVPLQRPFTLCISKIRVRRIWGIDRRYVMDTWLHHWKWILRNHLILRHRACRVWITKVSVANFMSSHHHYEFGRPPRWTMYGLNQVRFMRVCYRVVLAPPNKVLIKVDQMHLVVPVDPDNPNSQLMLLSTAGDENRLFQEVPPAVLAGLQPDPLPVGPDGVFIEPIDPVAGTLDIGEGGTGVFVNRPLEALGMGVLTLGGNQDDPRQLNNNQLQLYCWVLEPNGTIARETFALGGPGGAGAVPQVISLAVSPTPAIPVFEDENGVTMDNATVLTTTLTGDPNTVRLIPLAANQARIEWDGAGQLQAAPALLGNGPPTVWTDVPGGALSPVQVNLGTAMRYFRVRR